MQPRIQIQDSLLLDSVKCDSTLLREVAPIIGETSEKLFAFGGADTQMLAQPSNAWYFFFLLGLVLAYAVARLFLGQLLSSAFISTIRYSSTLSKYKDNSLVQNQRDNVLYAFYFFSLAFFFLILENRLKIFPFGLHQGLLYIFNFSLLLFIFISRIFLLRVVGHLFERRELFKEYLYHNFAFNKLLGIIFIPINFLLVYTNGVLNEIMIYFSCALLFLTIMMKLSRGVIFSFRHRVFSFYLFLYLCALEMVPVILLYKWFTTIV